MNAKAIPAPRDFLLTVPLYEQFAYEGAQVWDIIDALYFTGTYDSFCTGCGRESTFQAITPARPNQFVRNIAQEALYRSEAMTVNHPSIARDVYRVTGQCAREKSHLQVFLFLADQRSLFDESTNPRMMTVSSIQKIGQHPSYADLNLPKLKKYVPVLDKALLGELNRAVGLASHDVGVGAYVYLRRVFEALIEEAHRLAVSDAGWDEELYGRSRMSERTSLLKGHLPTFLVEHPEMYSLLSKGIHELSEQECLEHFDTLRIGIELILDEKLERKEREKKIQDAKAALSKAINATKA